MKAIAYSIKSGEKEPLIRANNKKHDITLISNRLTLDTVSYAQGKEAVLLFSNDHFSPPVITKLKRLGVKYICSISNRIDHNDLKGASREGIQVATIPPCPALTAEDDELVLQSAKIIENLDKWAEGINTDFPDKTNGTTDISSALPDFLKTPL